MWCDLLVCSGCHDYESRLWMWCNVRWGGGLRPRGCDRVARREEGRNRRHGRKRERERAKERGRERGERYLDMRGNGRESREGRSAKQREEGRGVQMKGASTAGRDLQRNWNKVRERGLGEVGSPCNVHPPCVVK